MFSTKFGNAFGSLLIIAGIVLFATSIHYSQPKASSKYQSQEVSETVGIPVLVKHLPDWENIRDRTTFAKSVGELNTALGEHAILNLIDFSVGTEAVTAQYDAGKLLIVEFSSPQGSVDADTKFTGYLAESGDGTTIYRRIGNYNAFVFDAADKNAAGALLDQVKYEKEVHWLGDNPFLITAERAFVLTTADIFLSTAIVVMIGIGISIFCGIIAGYVFFYFRDGKRSRWRTFSDAGGMTRLNLDGFTPDVLSDHHLED
jgi:ABC-type glycerol-3-phosphate transport system permease component